MLQNGHSIYLAFILTYLLLLLGHLTQNWTVLFCNFSFFGSDNKNRITALFLCFFVFSIKQKKKIMLFQCLFVFLCSNKKQLTIKTHRDKGDISIVSDSSVRQNTITTSKSSRAVKYQRGGRVSPSDYKMHVSKSQLIPFS